MGKIDTWWLDFALKAVHTGSRVICYPPVEDTDDDYILLVDEGLVVKFEQVLLEKGWKLNQRDYGRHKPLPLAAYPSEKAMYEKDGSVFHSWRKDELNLILTASDEYFTNFVKATILAKELNLKNKEDRITLFEAICRDRWPIPPNKMFLKDDFRSYNIKLL